MIIGGCMTKYKIGVDFGTERGWAVLLDVSKRRELATSVQSCANGVIDGT
jgi:ribulose kinase